MNKKIKKIQLRLRREVEKITIDLSLIASGAVIYAAWRQPDVQACTTVACLGLTAIVMFAMAVITGPTAWKIVAWGIFIVEEIVDIPRAVLSVGVRLANKHTVRRYERFKRLTKA